MFGAVAVLCGCTPSGTIDNEEGALDFDEARTELITLLDEAEAVIGGEWKVTEFGARDCTTSAGEPGAHMMMQRLGPPVEDGLQRDIADQLASVFATAGYEPSLTDTTTDDGALVIRGVYPGDGLDDEGIGLEFGVSPKGSTLWGATRCVAADADRINEERQQRDG
jgi:hypothetical protein